jgi:hypothetical protein
MTPKEKAEELISIFLSLSVSHYDDIYDGIRDGIRIPLAKKSALIAVEQILEVVDSIYDYDRESLDPYWNEVKSEIEKL